MIEYNIGLTKMKLVEEDELLGLLFYYFQELFEVYIQEYKNEIEKLASNIYLSKSTLEKYKDILKNAKSDTETEEIKDELFDIYTALSDSKLNSPIEGVIEKIYKMYDGFSLKIKNIAQEKMLGNQSVEVEKCIDEFQKRIKHSDLDVDDEYKIYPTYCVAPQKGVFRKYYAYAMEIEFEAEEDKTIDDVDFLITCADENTRRRLINELRDDCELYLLYMLGKLSEKCGFGFSNKLYSWEEHKKFIQERNQIFKMASQGNFDKERMIKNIIRFPLNPYQYVLWERTFGNVSEWEMIIKFFYVNLKAARGRFDEYMNYLNASVLEDGTKTGIFECVQKNIDKTDGWTFVGENLKNTSPRQYQKAKINLGIKDDEDVFMLADGTMFKSFKEGFAVCSSGIYLSSSSRKVYKDWKNVRNCKIEAGHGSNIRIDGIEIFTFADVNKCVQMFEDIKQVLNRDKKVNKGDVTVVEKQKVRFCSECGEKIQEGAKFCQNCGNKVVMPSNARNDEVRTKFDVELTSVGNNKVKVIKVVKDTTNLELKEAKQLVDSAPRLFREGVSKEEANYLKEQLQNVGAVVTIK